MGLSFVGALARKGPVIMNFLVWEFAQGGTFVWCLVWCGNFSWRLLTIVWKLEREKLKRRVHGGNGAGREIVRDFLTKLHSNCFCAVLYRTVSLGSTNQFFSIFIFMPNLAYYQKVWVRAFYCPKMSL